ncbi:MAG TPA: MFS transporter [Ohtaekwangia sp.]|nr:MFS transporter [Ohtaekwangia sp.]
MKHDKIPVALVATMFLTIGVMFCMNDILLPIVKESFNLSYLQATFIQISFYIVYILWPVLVTRTIERYGYRKNIIGAMLICTLGCLVFVPAYFYASYGLILLGIFTISTGVTVVNVAANPYTTLLGSPAGAHVRLNFVQAFSRIGYAATPLVSSMLIFGYAKSEPQIHIPYVVLALLVTVVVVLMSIFHMPDHTPAPAEKMSVVKMFRKSRGYRQLWFGIPAMFFYVGAEACTSGFFISYMTTHSYSQETAATFLTFYYILAALFALLGTLLLSLIKASTLLGIFGSGMTLCYAFVIWGPEFFSPYMLIATGGFLSVMFPTVFGLAIENLNGFTEKGSALLNFAIVGGAVFPPIQGMLADLHGINLSYIVPGICILVVSAYGFNISVNDRLKMNIKTVANG